MEHITTLTVRGRCFEIVKHEGHFCAVEDKYIDEVGKLTETLTGVQLNASRELDQCIKLTKNLVEIDYLVEHGFTEMEAFAKVMNVHLGLF